jgi:hypothetical protein
MLPELGQRAGKRLACDAQFRSQEALGHFELNALRLVTFGMGAMLDQPIREAGIGIFQSEIIDQAHQAAHLLAHGPEQTKRQFPVHFEQAKEFNFLNQ